MSNDYRVTGIHQINKWLWFKLKDFVWDGTNKAFNAYKDSGNAAGVGLIPIIPRQQIPEFTGLSDAPFIVYNYVISPRSTEFFLKREQGVYTIYDTNPGRSRAIQNYMVDLLEKWDWTAKQINDYIWTDGVNTNDGYDFKYVGVSSATSADPAQSEGGRIGAMVIAHYEYTHEMNGQEFGGLRT
jgi:hypothetical protein